MAVIKEKYNDKLVRSYSDKGFYLRQIETGVEYSEAIDLITSPFTYEEIEGKLIPNDHPVEEDDANE
ncbi:hypothetical protein [Enterococcus sp. DIV0800]|uniref:hypothetical protein n=1 Tax=unclassified Enterococcus TaxID=2608891 RepID=UPI003D2FEECD